MNCGLVVNTNSVYSLCPMMTVHEVLKAIGRQNLAREINLTPAAISNAASSGIFPATWFPTVRRLGTEAGVDVPESLFNWRVPSDAVEHQNRAE